MPILPSKDIPLGAQDQPTAYARRWKINQDWLHELVQLNPSIGLMTAPLEHRVVIQAVTMAVAEELRGKTTEDFSIMIDWDAFHDPEYGEHPTYGSGNLFFVCTNPQFKLTEWETEPTFGHHRQIGGWGANVWAVSNEWLRWALKKLEIDNLRESRNSRLRVSSFVIDKVAKLAGQDPNSVSVIIDWDLYVNEGSRFDNDIPSVIFITSVEIDLRQVAPAVEPHGSATLMEQAAESSVVSTQEGGIKHTQLQGVELKGLKNQPADDNLTAGLLGDVREHLSDKPNTAIVSMQENGTTHVQILGEPIKMYENTSGKTPSIE